MTSVRTAAAQYLDIRAPLTLRHVGAQVGQPGGSTRTAMDRLEQEWSHTFSGSLLPSSVKGTAWLRMASDGHYWFQGHVHENGLLSHSWSFAAGPNVVDQNKNVFVAIASGRVTDDHSSDDFSITGQEPRIAELWEQIRYAPVSFRLDVTANFAELAKKVGMGILTALGISVLAGTINVLGAKGAECHEDSNGRVTCYTKNS
ncbi:hypothetical protein OOJ91_30625 [Micromonospora lupini]|uniref:hypothetical protein n=1 Tax=Micromonospora lupini TaxID=285679 RepID=UPI002254A104|nr:hypothetical protein [Micromonospora lupini]MCX5070210.1 hypothetical protein [Micromonospora lupini]